LALFLVAASIVSVSTSAAGVVIVVVAAATVLATRNRLIRICEDNFVPDLIDSSGRCWSGGIELEQKAQQR